MAKEDDVFDKKAKAILSRIYDEQPVTVDKLPYTEAFDKIYAQFVAESGDPLTRHDVMMQLYSLRKLTKDEKFRLKPKHRTRKPNKFNDPLEGAPN